MKKIVFIFAFVLTCLTGTMAKNSLLTKPLSNHSITSLSILYTKKSNLVEPCSVSVTNGNTTITWTSASGCAGPLASAAAYIKAHNL